MNVEIIGTVSISPQEVNNNALEPRGSSRLEDKYGTEMIANSAIVAKMKRSSQGEALPTTSVLSGNALPSPMTLRVGQRTSIHRCVGSRIGHYGKYHGFTDKCAFLQQM